MNNVNYSEDIFEYNQQLTCLNEKCKEIPKLIIENGIKVKIICTNQECVNKNEISIDEFFEKNKPKQINLPSNKCVRFSNHKNPHNSKEEAVTKQSIKYCSQCDSFFCEECLKKHDEFFVDEMKNGKHQIKDEDIRKKEIENNLIYIEEKNLYYCKFHQSEISKYHCEECNVDFCENCNLIHKNHTKINLEDMSKEINVDDIKENIAKEKNEINEYIEKYNVCSEYISK